MILLQITLPSIYFSGLSFLLNPYLGPFKTSTFKSMPFKHCNKCTCNHNIFCVVYYRIETCGPKADRTTTIYLISRNIGYKVLSFKPKSMLDEVNYYFRITLKGKNSLFLTKVIFISQSKVVIWTLC